MALTTTGAPFSLNVPGLSSDLADLFGSYLVPNMSAINTYAAHKSTAQTFTALQTFSSGLNVTSGNVGIGTTSPLSTLHVVKDAGATLRVTTQTGAGGGNSSILMGNQDSGGANKPFILRSINAGLYLGTGDSWSSETGGTLTTRMIIDSAGAVGIGTTSPGYQLTLSTDSAAKPTSNTWTISSDARVKEIVGPYTRGVADIVALQPKRYRLNGAFGSVDDGRVHVSVIAQEAQATWPEMIGTYDHTDKDADDVETVTELLNLNTNELQWALVNAIKELAQRVEALER